MAHSKSALKRWRQNEAHRERNKPVRTGARTAVKKAHAAIVAGVTEDAQAAIAEAAGILDRAAKHNVVHPNAVSRHKSRMAKHLNKVAGGFVAEAPKKGRKTSTKQAPKAKAKAAAKPATKAAAKPAAKAAAKPAAKPKTTRTKAADKS